MLDAAARIGNADEVEERLPIKDPPPRSAQVSRSRPFYSAHADAYDLLITDPVEPWVSAVHRRLIAGNLAPAAILDAGCGTGRHAAALHALGHRVTLADASDALLRIAARSCPSAPALRVDLCALDRAAEFTAVTCRGVLNDLVTDDERQTAITALATSLVPDGILFADVREATASRARADGRPRSRVVTLPGGGSLTFTAISTWSDGLIRVHEEHRITGPRTAERSEYDFTMRPWSADELRHRFEHAGLRNLRIEPGVGRRTPDRLFLTAARS
jgi:SAM-dependent methyltransferase